MSREIIFVEGKLPESKNRITNCWYEHRNEIIFWNGKRLNCKHKKQKSNCVECKGNGVCAHNKRKSNCTECKGSGICEHNKLRYHCVECKGSGICEHNKQKYRCVECKGSGICEHGNEKYYCKDCKGSGICEHNKRINDCPICSNDHKNFCDLCKSIYVKSCPYYPLCFRCYCMSQPNEKIPRRYKLKQHYIHDKIKELYSGSFVYDKTIEGGCSNKRPDFLFDKLTHSVIIEIDENQHTNYSCENKRIMMIFEDLGNRPLIMIRFNPDEFDDNKSCFNFDINNKIIVNEKEFDTRIEKLLELLKYHLNNIPDKEMNQIKLYFDTE